MDKIKNILGLTLLGAIVVFASANATISNPPQTATIDTSTFMLKASNLSDLISSSTARLNLGLTDTATIASSTFLTKATNYKTIQWSASYATSTSQFDDPIFTFKNNVTIDNVYVSSRDAANTVSWNLVYSTDPTTATSSAFKLFSSTQVTTSTPTSARNLTTFASSTPSAGMTLRLYSAVASSTLTTWTIYYHEL